MSQRGEVLSFMKYSVDECLQSKGVLELVMTIRPDDLLSGREPLTTTEESVISLAEEYIEEPMSDGDDGTGPQPTGEEEDNCDEEEDGKGDGNPIPPEKE